MEDLFLFVLGYYLQLSASGILMYRIRTVKSIYGLSLETQLCFLFASLLRCFWTLNTRIVDTSSLFALGAYLELFASLVAAGVIVYHFQQFKYTTTMTVPVYLTTPVLLGASLIIAFLFNPGQWFSFTTQVIVAMTMYSEAAALVPQLWLIRRMDDVEALTSHYVALLILARAVRMLFWVVLFFRGQKFICLFLSDILHTVLSADYLYLWFKKLRNGGKLVYSLDSFNHNKY
jgi:ER lumen protein retaining receptor